MKSDEAGQAILELSVILVLSAVLLKGIITIHRTQEKVHRELLEERNEAIRKLENRAAPTEFLDDLLTPGRSTSGVDESLERFPAGS